jgi:hypothetical protein
MLDRRAFAARLAALGGACLTRALGAPGPELRLMAGETAEARELLQRIKVRFPGASDYAPGVSRLRAPGVLVALGPQALARATAERFDALLVSLLVSRQGYERLQPELAARGLRSTAIYAEASPAQQMRLIAAIFRREITVATLVSPASEGLMPDLQRAATEARLRLLVAEASPGVTMSRLLSRVEDAQALLLFPDATLYTPASLRELLEASYRRRLPVIGFSPSLVRAGTLASAYADADGLVSQLAAIVDTATGRQPPVPQYPRFWRVAVNDSVARSLDIVVDDDVRRLGDRP